MAKMRLIWVDIGMAVMVGLFLAIVIFLRDETYYMPLLFGYGTAVMVWAFLAESAAIRAEHHQPALSTDPGAQRDTHTKLLPH